jgi:hypothetical protein
MSKNIDLIAVATLILAFMFAAHVHQMAQISMARSRLFNVRPVHPIVVSPPRVPAVPRFAHWPRVQY